MSEEKSKREELTRKLQKAHDQLQRLSLTDELTGLRNRRYFHATIPDDVAQVFWNYRELRQDFNPAGLNNIDIVFIMASLDHFKTVNDPYGHAAGDRVLIRMRQLLTNSCREMDT